MIKRTSKESSQDDMRVKRDTMNEKCEVLNTEKLSILYESFNSKNRNVMMRGGKFVSA